MIYYADIHSHMLAGVDDGAANDTEMYEMLDTAYKGGTRTLCLTPHFNTEYFGDNREISLRVYEKLREYANDRYPDMRLCLGNELFYHFDAISSLVSGTCRTLNSTRYVLVDFTFDSQLYTIRSALLDLLGSGYIPVFAHVERYDCIKPPFRELEELKELGVKIQINSTSLCGGWGKALRKKTMKLLRQRIPDIAASDAHDLAIRTPSLAVCETIITETCGSGYANALLCANPLKIIGIR